MERARAARAPAHEARAPAAPVPRQVRAAARRDLPAAALHARPARPRPVRRQRHDARGVLDVRLPVGRRGRLGVQRPARVGQDAGARRRRRRRRPAAPRWRASRPARARRTGRSTRTSWTWYAPRALDELLRFRSLVDDHPASADLLRIVLCRAARSARLTTHFDLDFPQAPAARARTGAASTAAPASRPSRRPSSCAATRSTRPAACASTRSCAAGGRGRSATATRATLDYGAPLDGLVTSPPYPGRIDYHGQHRYAFALLGLRSASRTRSAPRPRAARAPRSRRTSTTSAACSPTPAASCAAGAPVVIVIDDSQRPLRRRAGARRASSSSRSACGT